MHSLKGLNIVKKKCNHLIAHIEHGWETREIRQRTIINQLFRLAKKEYREIVEQGYHPTKAVNPGSYLDKRTSYAGLLYKYCPDCGSKNVSLTPIKKKLKDKWTVERIIEDI